MEKPNIYKKLFELQKLNIVVKKVGTNPHFQSSYSTINEVLSKVKPELNKLKILVIQEPQAEGLKTILKDMESNTEISGFMKYAEVNTQQKIGSSNTYCRRYSLVTLLGLEDEDDDGNIASAKPTGIKPEQQAKYDNFPEEEYVPVEEAPATVGTSNSTACPKCGKTLVEKSGQYGKFLSCPGYPDCKHTQEVK